MARARRLFNVFVGKRSFLDAFSSWKRHLGVDSFQGAMVLALHILLSHLEAGQRGYGEISLVDPDSGQSVLISTDEILWEYGEKRLDPRGDVLRISFLLPPAYVYSLMPAIMRHLGMEDPETALFFGFALLELYAHAVQSGLHVVACNPAEDSRMRIRVSGPEAPRDLHSWPLYVLRGDSGGKPSMS